MIPTPLARIPSPPISRARYIRAYDFGLVIGSIQVDGEEMDVEMQGKTKAEGKVDVEGSIQQGKEKVRIHCQHLI